MDITSALLSHCGMEFSGTKTGSSSEAGATTTDNRSGTFACFLLGRAAIHMAVAPEHVAFTSRDYQIGTYVELLRSVFPLGMVE